MSRADKIDAQIAALKEAKKLAKVEEDFAAKKAAGTVSNADKQKLRAARQEYREQHRRPVADGAAPAAIGASASPSEV